MIIDNLFWIVPIASVIALVFAYHFFQADDEGR